MSRSVWVLSVLLMVALGPVLRAQDDLAPSFASVTALKYSHSGDVLGVAYGNRDEPCGNFLANPEVIGVYLTSASTGMTKIFDDCTVIDMAFSPDDATLWTVSLIGRIFRFDTVAMEIAGIGDRVGRAYVFYDQSPVGVVAYTLIDNNLFVIDSRDETVDVDYIDLSIQLTAGSLDAYGNNVAAAFVDGSVSIISTADLAQIVEFSEHVVSVSAVEWSPDSVHLASGDEAGLLKLWSVNESRSITTIQSHTGTVHGLDWSPDGTRIATAGEDGTVKVWDASNGALLDTLTYPGPVYALDWHPNGEQIAYGGADLTGSPPEVVIADAPEIPPTATPIDN